MGTFPVPARLANPQRPEQSLTIDLLVDTGATWTMLPGEIVNRLGLATPRQRMVTLASGDRVSYPAWQVTIQVRDLPIPNYRLPAGLKCKVRFPR